MYDIVKVISLFFRLIPCYGYIGYRTLLDYTIVPHLVVDGMKKRNIFRLKNHSSREYLRNLVRPEINYRRRHSPEFPYLVWFEIIYF